MDMNEGPSSSYNSRGGRGWGGNRGNYRGGRGYNTYNNSGYEQENYYQPVSFEPKRRARLP